MAKPLKLITQEQSWQSAVREDVVDTLKTALKEAKRGEINGVGIAATRADGGTMVSYSKRVEAAALLGAVARLNYRLLSDE